MAANTSSEPDYKKLYEHSQEKLAETKARHQVVLKSKAAEANAHENFQEKRVAFLTLASEDPLGEEETPPVDGEDPDVDPGDPEPVDPEPVGPPDPDPTGPFPAPAPLYALQGHKSGLIVPLGIAFNSRSQWQSYEARAPKIDVHASWCRPNNMESWDPRVLDGSVFFKASWSVNGPPGTARVVMYRMVPGKTHERKDIFKEAKTGRFDEMWRKFARAFRAFLRSIGAPWGEVRLLWEMNGKWYDHSVWPDQVEDAKIAMVRCANVMAEEAPELHFSVGFASPGQMPWANTDILPALFEEVPNWRDGKSALLPRRISTISLSFYNKGGMQSSATQAGVDAATWEKKVSETRNGAPSQPGSWFRWALKHGWNVGIAESGNWGNDIPYYVDGMIGLIKKYEKRCNYVCLLGSGEHQMFGSGAHCPKTGARWLQEIPKRLMVGASA